MTSWKRTGLLTAAGCVIVAAAGCGNAITGGASSGDGGLSPASVDAAPAELAHGLRGEYFKMYNERVVDRVDAVIDMSWADGELAPGTGSDRVSVRWTGYLDVEIAGEYTLATSNDDGVRVYIDGQLVIDDWRFHYPERHQATVDLPAGFVPLRVEYFEVDLGAEMRLSWSSTALGMSEEIIPTERLRAAPAADPAPAPHPPFQNPVFANDCPDPGVTATEGGFHMVCTGGSFPIRYSPDLVFWSDTEASVLPDGKAPWSANGGRNWAPEIHQVGNQYVAYFTAVNGANVLSIGAASAPTIEGPYTDIGAPLVESANGVIDASYFRDDDGRRYLTVKLDGNSVGEPTPILLRELAPDGLSFAPGSSFQEILRNDPATFEGGVVEAQWLIKHEGMYYLFYSANVYDHRYRTSVARSASLGGPYVKRGAPILSNNADWVGPGHGSVVPVGDSLYFVYHAWRNNGAGLSDTGGRRVLVDKISWVDGWPTIAHGSPSSTLQPWPGD